MVTTSKPWDRKKQFIRINSPSENRRGVLDGNGHARGTRRPSDFGEARTLLEDLVIRELLRLTPSWATTDGTTDADAEQEMFGSLKRSFQTWTDAPPEQWHLYYDWNFHIEPEQPWAWLRGLGNSDATNVEIPPTFKQRGRDRIKVSAREAVVKGHCAELEWDTGAFGTRPGSMFNQGGNQSIDWAWPMTDDFLWARGLSIYDGGHEAEPEEAKARDEIVKDKLRKDTGLTSDDDVRNDDPHGGFAKAKSEKQKAKEKEEKEKREKIARSELHPVKAIASARWEAHRFAGEKHFLPANQFMFFTSRLGGYKNFDSLAPTDGEDYEFIVDIPEPSGAFTPMTLDIGATSDFPLNRLVLRQEPLIDIDFTRYLNAKQSRPGFSPSADAFAKFPPKVELLPEGDDPKKRQVRVTIPVKEFAKANPKADFYGVLVSIGWPDPDGELAKRVKRVTVHLDKLVKAKLDHDTFAEEWRFKVGVNGRWFQYEFDGMHSDDEKKLNTSVTFHLFEEDAVRVSAHGAELDLVDDVYQEGNRKIDISPDDVAKAQDLDASADETRHVIDWRKEVETSPKKAGAFVNGSTPTQRAIAGRIFDMMFTTFNDQNDPLGLIDADRGTVLERQHNPMIVKKFIEQFAGSVNKPEGKAFKVTGMRTEEVGDTAELVQAKPDTAFPSDLDYTLEYRIAIEDQAL
jgi:hypothetical protein